MPNIYRVYSYDVCFVHMKKKVIEMNLKIQQLFIEPEQKLKSKYK